MEDINLEYIENNPILKKSLDFSIEIVKYCKILKYKKREYFKSNE